MAVDFPLCPYCTKNVSGSMLILTKSSGAMSITILSCGFCGKVLGVTTVPDASLFPKSKN